MNAGEYGISFNMNVNFNINAFVSLSLVFTRPDGSTFTRPNGVVVVPGAPLVVPGLGTFAANQYITYIFQAGDITIEGEYLARLTYIDGTKQLISDVASFTVNS